MLDYGHASLICMKLPQFSNMQLSNMQLSTSQCFSRQFSIRQLSNRQLQPAARTLFIGEIFFSFAMISTLVRFHWIQ